MFANKQLFCAHKEYSSVQPFLSLWCVNLLSNGLISILQEIFKDGKDLIQRAAAEIKTPELHLLVSPLF